MDTSRHEWALEVPVKVSKVGHATYLVAELNGARTLGLSFLGTRLHFDGVDIETERYFDFLGMIDAAEDSPNGVVVFDERFHE